MLNKGTQHGGVVTLLLIAPLQVVQEVLYPVSVDVAFQT